MELDYRVVTLVFTDIEGSTGLLRRLHDAYAGVLGEHHAILDRCFGKQGGTRLSTEGDGSFFVFPTTTAAVRAAVAAQDEFRSRKWPKGEQVRVRMGIHTGEAAQTAQGGYVGLAVHLAARIAALGHGGQILVSDTARQLLDHTDVTADLVDLGLQRLVDFPEPVRVHQVGTHSERFAPLRSAVGKGLPATIGRLFGREDEIAELVDAVSSHRLVTVLGPGGTGKTRLVIETGPHLLARGAPVYFVDLTGLSTVDLLPAHIAGTLELVQDPSVSPLRQIAATLGRRRGVLVLDNCEHLMPRVAAIVVEILEADPQATILATSRVPLSVPGERFFDLEPLEVGADDSSPALALFLDRAADVTPDFVAEEESMVHVRQIVQRLDGLPLAIELAASMTRFLPVDELAQILDERLDVLEGGPARPDRHRSLAAALRWSADSLDPETRAAFEMLGVMTGPFTLNDLGRLLGASPMDALRIATRLRDHSLVARTRVNGHIAFRMLETIRWFALESLQQRGSDGAARTRHLELFASVARAARDDLRGRRAPTALGRLWPKRPNLLAALDHAIESGRYEAAVEIVEGLVDAWSIRATGREARIATTKVLDAVAGGEPGLELRAVIARLEMWQAQGVGVVPERALAERAFELASLTGDPGAQVRARIWMIGAGALALEDHAGLVAELEARSDSRGVAFGVEALGWMLWWQDGSDQGRELFRRLHRQAADEGDLIAVLDAVAGLMSTEVGSDTAGQSEGLIDEATELAETLGCGWWESFVLQTRAEHSRSQGYLDESSEWLNRAYRIALERGTISQIAFIVANQATLAWVQGDVETSYAKTVEFADANSRGTDIPWNPFVLEMAAAAATAWGQFEEAARLCGAAEAWRTPGVLYELGMPLPSWDSDRHAEVVGRIEGALTVDEVRRLWEAGAAMDPAAAIVLALNLSGNRAAEPASVTWEST
ncbi:MAG TPA: adenylate/guanylate cyclase domain-containing protein [Acidimicrobiia bacterium]|nr:adenylate/guanylate cyclase domain-containing protein [Acidimicrobiia bacterium]